MSTTPPPPVEVLVEFLRDVVGSGADDYHGFVPVLRGSLLMHRWFGGRARPPADIDLECFDRPVTLDPGDDPEEFERPAGTYGRHGEFGSRVDLGKAMCRIAVNHGYYGRERAASGIAFDHVGEPPADGASLWVYGTPGTRYYAGWSWAAHPDLSGRLQIDLAEPGPYALEDLGIADEAFAAPGGVEFRIPAYSREAMLAAKVSWLVRGARRDEAGVTWAGEPKDLFDAHLILTAGDDLRPDVFRRAMLAVGGADGLAWPAVGDLFAVARGPVGAGASPAWTAFAARHPGLAPADPAGVWAELAARLGPLLGDLYPVAEMPFLAAVAADPDDETPYLVYADWLDDRTDDRAAVVRQIARLVCRPDEPPTDDPAALRAAVAADGPWLHHLFGTSARLRAFRERVGSV